MARDRPYTTFDELAFILRERIEYWFLIVRNALEDKTRDPDQKPNDLNFVKIWINWGWIFGQNY